MFKRHGVNEIIDLRKLLTVLHKFFLTQPRNIDDYYDDSLHSEPNSNQLTVVG